MVYKKDFLKDLNNAESLIWNYLLEGTKNKKSKFNYPAFSTCYNSRVFSRTVILRKVDIEKKLLFFYTDIRSKKVLDIKKNSASVMLVYDEKKKLQIQLYGSSKIEKNNSLVKNIWRRLSKHSKKNYQSEKKPGSTLKSFSEITLKSEQNNNHINFGIIVMKISKIELLQLIKNNNKRAIIEYKKTKKTKWIVP